MSNLSNILNFIADNGYSNHSFEKKCGLPNATLANAGKRDADLTTEVVETISKSVGKELVEAGYHVMDMRPFGRQELAVLSSEEAGKIVATLGKTIKINDVADGAKGDAPTVDLLAQALADQAAANLKHANNYGAIVILMEDMRNNMARADAQATIKDTLNRIDANLTETLTGVEFVSKMQLQEMMDLLSELKVQKTTSSQDVRKTQDENGGDGHRSGIRP